MEIQPVFQVSEFIETINQHLSILGEVTVEGEISQIRIRSGRLIFMTIADEHSSIDVFSLTHIVRNIKQLEEGMLVHVHGTAGLYKTSGRFRLFASQITPHGEGALQIAFDKLKKQLESEGLFDPSHKRPLPEWPQKIGLITAKDSSAYHDVIKILKARMGGLTIKHLPVNVQGYQALPTIKKAFKYINQHPQQFDLIIMARGGGSLEDLAAFNDEQIVRAVFSSKIPIISAIGHEDNWSLTDFVADIRASTPSNAAEIAVQDKHQVILRIDDSNHRIKTTLDNQISQYQHHVNRSLLTIKSHLNRTIHHINTQVNSIFHHLSNQQTLINQYRQKITQSLFISNQKIHHQLSNQKQQLQHTIKLLKSLDYQNTLKRGFSITQDQEGKIITHVNQTRVRSKIHTTLSTGRLESTITNIKLPSRT